MNNSNIDDFDNDKDECTRRCKYLKTTTEHFWNQCSKEYMNNLREHQIYNRRKYDSFNKLIVDDMVIIKDDDKLPRLRWKKRVIQELTTDGDTNVRGTVVRVIDNKGKIFTLNRDCKRLIPLELAKNITEDDSKRAAVVNADIIRKSIV